MKTRIVVIVFALLMAITFRLYESFNSFDYKSDSQLELSRVRKQVDSISCGPTSVQIVLDYYNINHNADDVRYSCKTEWFILNNKSVGMTVPEFIPYSLKTYGLKSKIFANGTLEEIKFEVSNERPVIVLMRTGETLWHYVVVVGYDEDSIDVADPGYGYVRKMPVNVFLDSWSFKSNMSGTEFFDKCMICDGKGRYEFRYDFLLGPLTKCELCLGTGSVNLYADILSASDVRPRTMITASK